jgi:hypothetical protein
MLEDHGGSNLDDRRVARLSGAVEYEAFLKFFFDHLSQALRMREAK